MLLDLNSLTTMCSPAFVYISASRARSASLCNRTSLEKSRERERERERDETDRPKEIAQTFRFERFSATARHFRVALVCMRELGAAQPRQG